MSKGNLIGNEGTEELANVLKERKGSLVITLKSN